MVKNKTYRRRALRIESGIMILSLVLLAGGAGGATEIDSCTTINSPGEYVLNQSILNSPLSSCINITASDVVFDGAGFTIDGQDAIITIGMKVSNSSAALTNVTVKNLIVKDWYYGINYNIVSNGNITNNNASNNYNGIYLSSSSNNNLSGNNANSNNNNGIFLYSSSNNNNLSGNNANSNYYSGILLDSSSNNKIYNNYFNNTNNAYDNGNNIWNTTKTAGMNIIGGPYLGGNFWSDYGGTDVNSDGLGDSLLPYKSNGNIINGGDFLPLVVSAFDFNIAASPQNQTIRPGGNAIFTLDITLLSGTSQNVNLAATVVNAGNVPEPSISSSIFPSTVLPNATATLFVGTNSTTPNGVYNVTINGSSGALHKTVNVSVIVSGPPLPNNPIALSDFTVKLVTGAPSADQIKVPVTGTFNITLVNGSTFSVTDNDATDGSARIQLIDNKFYKFYGRVTGGSTNANMTVLSPFIPGILMPQAVTLPKAAPPATVDLTSLNPFVLQIPAPASIVDTSKPWVSSYYPSIGLPYNFTNNGAQETQLIFILQ